ncbi:MAG: hypothetical protein ACHQ50_04715 [Fimbriimonadales bacterium]
MGIRNLLFSVAATILLTQTGDGQAARPGRPQAIDRGAAYRGSWGTYDAAPYIEAKAMKPEMRMDVDRLIKELVDLKVNTYCFLIWHQAVDWVELHRFLPEARKHGIRVWVYLTPPSEQPPIDRSYGYDEPFRMDYERWGRELARLSLEEPNLVGWCIDDFPIDNNMKVLTPAYLGKAVEGARRINPKFAFMPCVYEMTGGRAERLRAYKGIFDGIFLCHNLQSDETTEQQHRTYMEQNVAATRSVFGKTIPIVSFQFTTRWRDALPPSPQRTAFLLRLSRSLCDGVICYLHPKPDATNREAIREVFAETAIRGWRK